jgi:hypothetical protein
MDRQDLIDIASDAMSDAQDMDTTITDLAKAAIRALEPFMLNVDEHIKFAQECACIALRAKGYENGDVSMVVNFTHMSPWGCTIWLSKKGNNKGEYVTALTFSDAVAAIDAKICDLPHIWTDEQIAATLGIGAAA